MIVNHLRFKIYFGSSQDALSKSLDCIPSSTPLAGNEKFFSVSQKLGIDTMAFLNQTHSNQGMIVADCIPAFDADGDFLITAQQHIGIGVMTADCLPIALYDTKNHAAAVVHAGWRGSAERIAQEAVKMMQSSCGSHVQDLKIFFGPSAKVCCYQVNEEFEKKIEKSWFDTIASQSLTTNGLTIPVRPECSPFDIAQDELRERTCPAKPWRRRIEGSNKNIFIRYNNQLYFDLPLFNVLQLQEIGVPEGAISIAHNLCTICDHRFFSYRRQGQGAGRQMTIISLHE